MLKHLALLFLLGGAIETVWLLSCRLSPLRAHSGSFVALMLLSFVLCISGFFRCRLRDRRDVLCMLGFALLFRLTVLPATPDESEDVYRYLWDGKISSAGISPYLHPPEAPELESFRDPLLYPMLNSKSYITAYPPLSQAVFRACYALFGPSVLAMKAIFSLFEFASLLLAWRLLVSFGTSLQPLFLMAWNPFFVFEFSHSGHSDSLMMFLILLSIYLGHRRKSVWAMASVAGAILVKLHPALWIPLFWRRMGWKPAAVCLSVVGIGMYGCFSFQTLRSYLQSLRLYYRLFEFNAGIHYLLRFIGSSFFRQSWDKAAGPYLAVLLIVVVAGISMRFPLANARDVLHAGFWIMTADLCLATTVHPWYLVWAALALPAFPYAFMLYWTGACSLSYLAYAHNPVYQPRWVLLVEYLPMYALMAWEILRGAPLLQATDRVNAGRQEHVLPLG
jgi:alpha-1,6-mannosyltransferase